MFTKGCRILYLTSDSVLSTNELERTSGISWPFAKQTNELEYDVMDSARENNKRTQIEVSDSSLVHVTDKRTRKDVGIHRNPYLQTNEHEYDVGDSRNTKRHRYGCRSNANCHVWDSNGLPIQAVVPLARTYPTPHRHSNEPGVLRHTPLLHNWGSFWHSSTSGKE